MTDYKGSVFDFHFEIKFDSEQEFEDWLETKLLKYKFKRIELKMFRKILGIKDLTDRVKLLEDKVKEFHGAN